MKKILKENMEGRTAISIAIALSVLLITTVAAADILDAGYSTENGLVAEYRFETGAGDTAYDTAGNNDGTINGASWSEGIEGKALSFDDSQTDQYLEVPSSTLNGLNDFTISYWAKGGETDEYIFSVANSNTDNEMITHSEATSEWTLYTVTRENGDIKQYKNGVSGADFLWGSGPSDPINADCIIMAQEQDNVCGGFQSGQAFSGKLDNLNIYSKTLNQSQIKSIYNSGSWRVGRTNEQNDPDQILDLTFQHQDNSQVLDTSGYNNHGEKINGVSQEDAVGCKVGRCYSFDGEDDYIPVQGSYTNMPEGATVMAWIKTTSQGIVLSYDRSEIFRFGNEGGPVSWDTANSADGIHDMVGNTDVDDGEWHHIAATYDPSTSSKEIFVDGKLDANQSWSGSQLGTDTTRYGFISRGSEASSFNGGTGPDSWFKGEIDQLKMFNRSLSQQEIISKTKGLESNGAVLDMRFDGEGGDKVHDYSGESNHGDLMWNESFGPDRDSGIKGGALSFDGYDDRVEPSIDSTGEKPDKLTVSAWYKKDGATNGDEIVSDLISTPDDGFVLNDGSFAVGKGDGTGMARASGSTVDGEWTHVAGTYDGEKVKFFKNGEKIDETPFEGQYTKSSRQLVIGYNAWRNSNFDAGYGWEGKIDEVKILPYAASEDRVKKIYRSDSPKISASEETGSGIDLNDDLVLSQTFNRIEACGQSDTVSCPSGMSGEVAVDESGEANHGELVNGPSVEGAGDCKVGGCLAFDGADDVVVNENPSDTIDFGNNGSISFWLNHKGESDREGILGRGDYSEQNSDNNSWHIQVRDNEVMLRLYYNASIYSGEVPGEGWEHWMLSVEDDKFMWYRNGKKVSETTEATDIVHTKDLVVGNYDDGEYLEGKLDEIKIFNRSLSSEEAWRLYTSGRDREDSMSGPKAHWRMSSPGEKVTDVAGDNTGSNNPNLLDNSGFESGKDGTGNMVDISTNSAGYSELVEGEAKSGQYSGKHVKTGEDDQWSSVEWNLNLNSGQKYDVGAWYKCTGNVDRGLDVHIENGSSSWDGIATLSMPTTCDDKWRFVSEESNALPSNIASTNRVRFQWGYSTNSGTMYVDDMYLREDSADWNNDALRGTTMQFDGKGDHFDINETTLDSDSATLMGNFYIKDFEPEGDRANEVMFVKKANHNTHQYIGFGDGSMSFETNVNNEGGGTINSDKITSGKWFNAALIFDEGTAKLYVDGDYVGETSLQSNDLTFDQIGYRMSDSQYQSGYPDWYHGKIDDVRVYPYALNQKQISQVINAGSVNIG